MNYVPECLPCGLRRVLGAACRVSSDEWLHRKMLGEVMQGLVAEDELVTPAELMREAVGIASKTLGVADPYQEEKRHWLEETTANEDLIGEFVSSSGDGFLAALRLSIASNLLDAEFREELSPGFSLRNLLEQAAAATLPTEIVEDFRTAVQSAERILFVHATAGELLFDRLLIEAMGKKKKGSVVSVVREGPILAHATAADAEAAGLPRRARVIAPGFEGLGLPLEACSKRFRSEFAGADLVVAKGQAAYETLEGQNARIDDAAPEVYFLLRVKCAVMARRLGVSVGDGVLEPNGE